MTKADKMRKALETERDYLFQKYGIKTAAALAIQHYLNNAPGESLERLANVFGQVQR